MILIGEKINGAIPVVAEAIANRDAAFIQKRALDQEAAGADYLDVCAGTAPELEYDALCWLIDTVQAVATKPICIDSPNPEMLARVFPKLEKPGLINSISLEGNKCEVLLRQQRRCGQCGRQGQKCVHSDRESGRIRRNARPDAYRPAGAGALGGQRFGAAIF